MSARDRVFGKIRRALGVTGEEPRRNATVDNRLTRPPRGVIPARTQLPPEEQIALFRQMAERTAATTARVADAAAVPEAVADYLRRANLPAQVRSGDDLFIRRIDWGKTAIEFRHGASDGTDAVGLAHAFAGVAESGTLVMTSGKDNPTTLNFLPETEIVLLEARDITGTYESVWAAIRGRYGDGTMPRTVNWITGPSRSGDIEQKILLGAHGPRELHIIVVG